METGTIGDVSQQIRDVEAEIDGVRAVLQAEIDGANAVLAALIAKQRELQAEEKRMRQEGA